MQDDDQILSRLTASREGRPRPGAKRSTRKRTAKATAPNRDALLRELLRLDPLAQSAESADAAEVVEQLLGWLVDAEPGELPRISDYVDRLGPMLEPYDKPRRKLDSLQRRRAALDEPGDKLIIERGRDGRISKLIGPRGPLTVIWPDDDDGRVH